MTLFKIAALGLAVALPGIGAAQTAVVVETPAYVNLINDESITARLTEAGYQDIKIARDGNKLVIDATKDGTAQNLQYDLTSGALVTVDGAGYEVNTSAPGNTSTASDGEGRTDQGTTNNGGSQGGGTGGGSSDGGTNN